MKLAAPPTGRKIVLELEREMEERLYPLFFRTLPPAEYHVYLHPGDFRQIEAVVPLIISDAQRHLNDRVDRLNARGRWNLMAQKAAPIEVPPGGWAIFIQPAVNDEVGPGELGIVSRLAIPTSPSFDGGTPTVRIGRTVVTETIRRSTTSDEPAAPPPPAGEALTEPTPVVERSSRDGFATLTYVDEDGPHLFTMRSQSISIGRGGDAHWVDVQVTGSNRISREHCRIRRDSTGDFFLEDLSAWGTYVDGARVAPSLRDRDDRVAPAQRDRGEKVDEASNGHRLPRQARIELADVLVIEFTAASPLET